MQQSMQLAAGQWQSQDFAGAQFVLLGTGLADSVEVRLFRDRTELEWIKTAQRGFRARVADGFTRVELRAAVGCTVDYVVGSGLVDFDFVANASVAVKNGSNGPLQVQNDRGTPGNLLYVSGVSVNDAPAVGVWDYASTAASGAAAVQVAAAVATRREIRFMNAGPDPVALGSSAITWAKRVIVLDVGDVFIESRGSNLAWYAITDVGKSATVTRQEITA